MPRSLSPIPADVQITDGHGIVSIFFRLAWQLLVDAFQITPTRAALDLTNQGAAIVATNLFIVQSTGQHRVNISLTRTVDDGVSSSATVTIGWTQGGIARSVTETAVTEAGTAVQTVSRPIWADANSAITVAMGYASNTPNKARFDLHASAEQLA